MKNSTTSTGLLQQVEELIGDDLLAVEQVFAAELATEHPYVTDVLSHLTRYRGKRLRPMLVLLSAQATGSVAADHHVLGAVVEMIHTATLVHDDVLDDADTRRHVATINARWNNETSVLLGDYLFTHAFHLASSLESTLACRLIGRGTNLVCEGELGQIHERGNAHLSETDYLRIIEGKTAELCALSCHLGAAFPQQDKPNPIHIAALTEYGRCLGIAFQIADDLLDLRGREEEMGKTLGSDLQKQKLTLPLIRLLSQSGPEDAQAIREILSHPTSTMWSKLEPYFAQSDAWDYTRQRAEQFIAQATQELAKLPETPARRILEEIAEFTIQRSF